MMTETSTSPDAGATVTVDVVSDAVCPWCFVGKRNLAAALSLAPDAKVEVRWRPFQLDPTIPQGGMPRVEYLTRKFGPGGYGKMNQRLIDLGRERGIAFAFDRIERSPNTLDAHRLIRWAQPAGAQDAVVERLFQLYFEEGADIGDRNLLADVAAANGFDRAMALRMLESDTDKEAVQEEIATAQRMGVTGVPFFIFGGKYALSGAQPPEAIAAAIGKAREG
jgi:predicted DsbA family dithiol-disulfide isomerase